MVLGALPRSYARRAEHPAYALTDTVAQLSTATTLERVTDVVASAARSLMGADGATFVLREDDHCFYADEDAISPLWKGSRFPMSACVSGWVMHHRESVAISDIYVDDRVPIDAYRPTFVRSLAMTPVRRAEPIGAIGVYWSTEYVPSPQEMRLLEVLANSASVALENLELRGAVVRRQSERDELESAIHTLVHDLRSPLGAIRGYAELLEDGASPDDVQTYATTIGRAADRLEQQIDRMLGLYRITHSELVPAPVDLGAVSGEIADQLAGRHPHRVTFSAERDLMAQLDPVLGRLMLQNLLDNAFKYTGRTDPAEITLQRVDSATPLATFALHDNGAGFEPEHADLLFRPMQRLHDESDFAGTGLGLASVARIVELHGGTIRAEGVRGGGATFYLGLPVAASMPTA